MRVIFTTLRLLKLTQHSKLIATDAAYKLIWQGQHVLLFGTIDLAKHFHPICLVVTKREKAKDFDFVFKSIVDGVKTHFDFEYKPDTLQQHR